MTANMASPQILLRCKGFVTHVDDKEFHARIVEEESGEEYEMSMDVEKIPKEDQHYLSVGRYLTWILYKGGVSEFQFCDERWTQQEIEEIHARAEEIAEFLER